MVIIPRVASISILSFDGEVWLILGNDARAWVICITAVAIIVLSCWISSFIIINSKDVVFWVDSFVQVVRRGVCSIRWIGSDCGSG